MSSFDVALQGFHGVRYRQFDGALKVAQRGGSILQHRLSNTHL
jgi:hypothetical protein